jgi:thiol-disulfide isomerase/thioredoxin
MMLRSLLLSAAALMAGALHAHASQRLAYEAGAFRAAVESGKPVLVHVTAPWCGECKLQRPIVATLAQEARFDDLSIIDVDFDTQKDALRVLNVQKQSTLILFRGKAEVVRATGITRRDAIESLMNKAL